MGEFMLKFEKFYFILFLSIIFQVKLLAYQPQVHMLYLARTGDQKAFSELIKNQVNNRNNLSFKIDYEDEDGRNVLHHSAIGGNLQIIDTVLKTSNLDVDCRDSSGKTPLMLAAMNNHPSAVEFLLEKGATINAKDNENRNALMLCATKGNRELVDVLTKNSIRLDDQDNLGNTALIWATLANNLQMADALIASGADLDLQNKLGNTALIIAAGSNEEIAKILVNENADLYIQNNNQENATLMAQKKNKKLTLAAILIKKAFENFNKSNNALAVSLCKNILKLEVPYSNAYANYLLAKEALIRSKNNNETTYKEAFEYLNAIDVSHLTDIERTEVMLHYGFIYLYSSCEKIKDTYLAIQYFKEVLKTKKCTDHQLMLALNYLASLYFTGTEDVPRDFSKAKEHYEKLLSYDASAPIANFQLGRIYYENLNNEDLAEKFFQEAANQDKDAEIQRLANFYLAKIHFIKFCNGKSKLEYNKASDYVEKIELGKLPAEEKIEIYYHIGKSQYFVSAWDCAIEFLKEIIDKCETDSKNFEVLYYLGSSYAKSKSKHDLEKSVDYFERAVNGHGSRTDLLISSYSYLLKFYLKNENDHIEKINKCLRKLSDINTENLNDEDLLKFHASALNFYREFKLRHSL